ncbi:MAG: hypothetical protein JSV82_08620 [Planctomycetota bacterium]|nr:MAG: hypothetical protein JSV82_08620 [Planctomycetota bacterium]
MKLRIAAAVAVGVILIGFAALPLAAPAEPFGVVSVLAGDMTTRGAVILVAVAFVTGIIAYFLSWPHGRQIGILAVPAGLSIWALRYGSMADLVRVNSTSVQRLALFDALKWEPLFWLGIVAAGFGGVLMGQKLRAVPQPEKNRQESNSKSNKYLNIIIALVGSVLIAQFCIRVFAQDVKMFDVRLGSVVAQPSVGQIVFAVLVSFGIAAFVVKEFLDVSYIWPVVSSALVTGFVIMIYIRQDVVQQLVERQPVVFFSNAVVSILPVQMVAFGTLGSIVGYWLAIRYNYLRKHA